jgi:catalase
VTFHLKFQIPTEDDPIDDPTAVWPEDRERVAAGTLEITHVVDDPEGGDHIEVFDPTRAPDGIELSGDPILHARARAYSVSAYRRLGMDVQSPSTPPAH